MKSVSMADGRRMLGDGTLVLFDVRWIEATVVRAGTRGEL
jgi:hypothetical protein